MNWWVEYNVTIFRETETARQGLRESGQFVRSNNIAGADAGCAYYQLTDSEFNAIHPCLTLKEILIGNRGISRKM